MPKHSIATEQEVAGLLEKFGKPVQALPLIATDDPAIKELGAREGDVIRIDRNSPTTGKVEPYYRLVSELDD